MKLNGRKPKLTAAQAAYVRRCEAIRKRWMARIPSRHELAEAFGVSKNTIACAATGLSNKHHRFEAREAARHQAVA